MTTVIVGEDGLRSSTKTVYYLMLPSLSHTSVLRGAQLSITTNLLYLYFYITHTWYKVNKFHTNQPITQRVKTESFVKLSYGMYASEQDEALSS
jgi:hypothetical protein